jgi:hypothetical protein
MPISNQELMRRQIRKIELLRQLHLLGLSAPVC